MMRSAVVNRETLETKIYLELGLEGTGKSHIVTGIGFFDHMLTLCARHGLMDLTIQAEGDIHVDCHHTIEDVGIVFGKAVSQALHDRAGIRRYGSGLVPMDEALARCVMDVSGRPFLVFEGSFPAERIGAMDTEMVEEFFRAFCQHGGITMHMNILAGKNSHHMAEACFKAFGRAMREAFSIDPAVEGVLSTKGMLDS